MIAVYQWHETQRNMIWNAINSRYIPNAILLSGEKGCGISEFAMYIAKIISCENSKNSSECNQCKSCNTINRKDSPNIISIGDSNESISVVDIRQMIDYAYNTPVFGEHQFIILDSIDNLSSSAMNALLKTLEEPARHVIFILISYHRSMIPLTIKSRSKEIYFPTPPSTIVEHFLTNNGFTEQAANMYAYISQYHPIDAMNLQKIGTMEKFELFSELITKIAEGNGQLEKMDEIKNYDLIDWLRYLELLLSDIVRLYARSLNSRDRSVRYFNSLKTIKKCVQINRVFDALTLISNLYYNNKILNIKSNKLITINDLNFRLFYQKNA